MTRRDGGVSSERPRRYHGQEAARTEWQREQILRSGLSGWRHGIKRYKIVSGRSEVQKSCVAENSLDSFIAVLWNFVLKGTAVVWMWNDKRSRHDFTLHSYRNVQRCVEAVISLRSWRRVHIITCPSYWTCVVRTYTGTTTDTEKLTAALLTA